MYMQFLHLLTENAGSEKKHIWENVPQLCLREEEIKIQEAEGLAQCHPAS